MDRLSEFKPRVCFEIEKVIGISHEGNVPCYHVQWAPAWVSGVQLVGCEDLIQEFLQQQQQQKQRQQLQQQQKQQHQQEQQKLEESVGHESEFDAPELIPNTVTVYQLENDQISASTTKSEIITEEEKMMNDASSCKVVKESLFSSCRADNVSTTCCAPRSRMKMDKKMVRSDASLYREVKEPLMSCSTADDTSVSPRILCNESSSFITLPGEKDSCTTSFYLHDSNCGDGFFDVDGDDVDSNGGISNNDDKGKSSNKKTVKILNTRRLCKESSGTRLKFIDPPYDEKQRNEVHTQQLYNKERSHHCIYCEKSLVHKSHLTRHMATHNNARPHKCEVCEKSFTRNDMLVEHMWTHGKDKPHKCAQCGKTFARNSALVRHLENHATGNPSMVHFHTGLLTKPPPFGDL